MPRAQDDTGVAGAPAGDRARRKEATLEPMRGQAVRGLDRGEAARRLRRDGPNELPPPLRERVAARFLRQLREPMALLLVAAAAVSGVALGERLDAAAILAIVFLNALIGLVQEGRAARALEALRAVERPTSRVSREGIVELIPSAEIVVGDLVLLAAGDRVPADLRLVATDVLEVDESLLTGESLPVRKDAHADVAEAAGLADRPWIALTGTLVTRGTASGTAVATGARTELGKLAERLRMPEPRTPLQIELARLTTRLGTIAVVVAAAVFVLTVARMGVSEVTLERAFLSAVALAVAAVPEGLATVVTVALALGVRRMARAGAIVRRLPAVETLGSTTLILTDKTGTLTENRMRLEVVALPGRAPMPLGSLDGAERDRVAEVAVLCNDATLNPSVGDPVDLALLEVFGARHVEALRRGHPRVSVLPADSERKRMTSLHDGSGRVLLVKGAPEVVLSLCTRAHDRDGGEIPLSEFDRQRALRTAAEIAGRGVRMLALARRDLPVAPERLEAAEQAMTFVGLVGLRDPVRERAAQTVAEARGAGIRVVMVTGDHAGTAGAVAEEVGLADGSAPVVTGGDLRHRGMPADPLALPVYARVDPDQKLALVEAARAAGEVVAVTGDGVNDAPALRQADIGVAMGRSGSDVAREAADMVVTDDDLATVVTAVREGRGIYDNVRKVVDYLVAGNLSEIIVVVGALILFPALGVPLLPLQLLWVNLLTDGLPAIALGVEPVSTDLMRRPPRRRGDRLLGLERVGLLSTRGLLMAAAALGALAVSRFAWNEPWPHARAVMFTVLVVVHLLYAFVARKPASKANGWLVLAVAAGLTLQVIVVLWPPAHELFGTAPLSGREWILIAVAGAVAPALLAAIERSRGGRVGGRVRSQPAEPVRMTR